MNAQCVLYSAPSAIHCLRTCLSASESGSLAAAGGIRSLASSAKIRLTSSLSSGLPGTMGMAPEAAGFTASLRTSRRSLAFRALSSGPWHLKQCRARIGRTWLVNGSWSARPVSSAPDRENDGGAQ